MARRKKPQITGRDPEYTSATHQFAKLPTHKPEDTKDEPEAIIPAAEPQEKPEAAPKTEQKTDGPPKPVKTKPRKFTQTAAPRKPKPIEAEALSGTRRVELLAALTPALHAKLQGLESLGIAYKDAMSVAGRRATKEFEATATYVEKTETERLPTSQAYRSSKSLPIETLEALHDAANPLRLASDGAMVRGQFEPLFWQHLEDVLKELADKYSK